MTTMTQPETFVREMERRARRLDQEFEQLIRKADSAERAVRERLREIRTDFVERRDELQRRLGEARIAGERASEELSDGVETAWNDLSDAFNRARAEFMQLS